jgi:hypothetical membrane protein
VNAHRLRSGALAWLLTLQFFVVETVAQLRWPGTYSRIDRVISDLGTTASPAHTLMNASFVVQGLLIGAGALLLAPALRGVAGRIATVLLCVAGLGVLLVGIAPSDGNATLHSAGAVAHFVGGGLGLIALAYSLRPRSEVVGTALALLGLVSTALTVFFLTGVTQTLGDGGTERLAAYPIPVGLALAGLALRWLVAPDPPSGTAGAAPSRRELREQQRVARAEQVRQRDAALEAAARRQEMDRSPGPADGEDEGEPDPEDPWAPVRRRDR